MCLLPPSPGRYSETSVNFCETTRRSIPQGWHSHYLLDLWSTNGRHWPSNVAKLIFILLEKTSGVLRSQECLKLKITRWVWSSVRDLIQAGAVRRGASYHLHSQSFWWVYTLIYWSFPDRATAEVPGCRCEVRCLREVHVTMIYGVWWFSETVSNPLWLGLLLMQFYPKV
jgi:hypothetical protein